MSDAALALAEYGQATIVTPFTLMGAMAPVTLGAALAQQNAEALFCIAMIQLFFPGSPVVYGGFTSNVDMRSGAPTFGTPENGKANLNLFEEEYGISPGQACVFYSKDENGYKVLGGGWITK